MTDQELQISPEDKPRFFYGYTVVAAAFLIGMVMVSTYFAFGVFFTPVLTEFGWTRAMTTGAFSLSWAIQGFLGIVIGGLNDRFGPRVVMTICGSLLGLGFLLMSLTNAIWQIYLFYGVIIGTGICGVFVPLMSTVTRWFIGRRSTMAGIVQVGSSIGIVIMPPLASWLISIYEWRLSYVILGSLVLVIVISAAQFLRRDPAQMGLRPYGERINHEEPGLRWGADGYLLKQAVHTRQFWVVFVMLFSLGFCVHTIIVHIVPHATELGISAASAANILATLGCATIVGRLVLGGAGDRVGNIKILASCLFLMLAAFIWLFYARDLWQLYLFAVVFGLAFGGCVTQQAPLVAVLYGLSSYGVILGFIGFGYTLGSAAGPFLAGYLFDLNSNYYTAFLVIAGIAFIGLILTVLLKSPAPESNR